MDKDAIYFPSGDHTTFPIMYFQAVQGERPDITIADKYGHIEKELYQGLIEQKKKAGKDAEKISRQEIEEYIILSNRKRPIYFYVKRDISDLSGYTEVPEGMLFRVIHKSDLRSYKKKVSEEYWKRHIFRYFEDPRVTRDYTADVVISDYHYARARCYFEEGQVERGIQEIEKLREAAEGFKEIFNNLGNMLAERGLFKEAIKLYEKAISYNPNYLTAIRNMAKSYRGLNDYDNCLKYLNRALEVNPYELDTHLEFAQTYIAMKEFDKAIAKLEDIIAGSPSHFLAYRLLGLVYLNEKKDDKKAFDLFQKSLSLNPDQPLLKRLLWEKMEKEHTGVPNPYEIPGVPKVQPEVPKPEIPVVPQPRPKIPQPQVPQLPR
jgi:tetratricopeptide (TPR) repeat protein